MPQRLKVEEKGPHLTLHVSKGRVQADVYGPPEGDERSVVHWKRIKISGRAERDDCSEEFSGYLDLKSRVIRIWVGKDSRVDARDVALAYVRELTAYATLPLSRLFHRFQSEPQADEWLTSEPEYVSGLMHKVGEANGGSFPARIETPIPAPLRDVLAPVIESVHENLETLLTIDDTRGHYRLLDLRFDLSVWTLHGARVVELSHDDKCAGNLVRFFGAIRSYDEAIQIIRLNPKDTPDHSARPNLAAAHVAGALIFRTRQEIIQLALRLLKSFANEAQRQRLVHAK